MKHILLPLLFVILTSCDKTTDRSEIYATIAGMDLDGMRAATLELRPDGQYYFTMELIGQTITGTYEQKDGKLLLKPTNGVPVSYTHLRAHETVLDLVCRLLLEKKHN